MVVYILLRVRGLLWQVNNQLITAYPDIFLN